MNKLEIINSIQNITDEVIMYVEKLSETELLNSESDNWSISGNVEHLILSIQPLSKAHKIPKFLLKYKFGKMNREGRSYEQVLKKYQNAMSKGFAPSPNPFGPKENKTISKKELLKNYKKETHKLIKSLNSWNEKQIDTYILPHPAIGKLSIREMLYFTHLHTNHHFNIIKQINK